ncbi:hypothetical protein L2E82_15255 [Cichorium intybus]|uniref:Uncharacterized protein n=1 Tax=Cichorium intybus TaxID=13427 RepID=A0ACB9F283_CICIN|nr:hypothetical protein L2E82_15255 [Cichorium intybus]
MCMVTKNGSRVSFYCEKYLHDLRKGYSSITTLELTHTYYAKIESLGLAWLHSAQIVPCKTQIFWALVLAGFSWCD